MDITYTYMKKRNSFGKQPMYCEVAGHIVDSINPDHLEQKKYILRNPVHNATQVSKPQSLHEINTKRAEYANSGANHLEGGWPKEININDEEAVSRFRRRVEREEDYIQAINNCTKRLEHSIKQNNAIEIYQMYFKNMSEEMPVEKYQVATKSVYRDPDGTKLGGRPISCIAWTIEHNSKLAITYCDRTYPSVGTTVNMKTAAYVWDLENPGAPSNKLTPPSPLWQVACSPVEPHTIVGGLEDGRVCIFDIRAQSDSVAIDDDTSHKAIASSPFHVAHKNPVSSLIYIQSRLNTEFFTGSTDGQCLWWDVRKLSLPIDSMIMAYKVPPGETISLKHSEPVSTLQFDRSFPTRFLCGTDTGLVLNVNRKGKTLSETMSGTFRAHYGPVKAVHRSPVTSKMFITCGDWTTHIWSDEIHDSPIIVGKPNRYPINDVCWAPFRISAYMTISTDGTFRFWDILRKFSKPTVEHHISRFSLLKMKMHSDGRFVAIGDSKGRAFLISLSDNLVLPTERDKPMMVQAYERETRREHILENRIKEIRLKLRTEDEEGDGRIVEEVVDDDENNCRIAEEEYKKMVQAEWFNIGRTYKSTATVKKPAAKEQKPKK